MKGGWLLTLSSTATNGLVAGARVVPVDETPVKHAIFHGVELKALHGGIVVVATAVHLVKADSLQPVSDSEKRYHPG